MAARTTEAGHSAATKTSCSFIGRAPWTRPGNILVRQRIGSIAHLVAERPQQQGDPCVADLAALPAQALSVLVAGDVPGKVGSVRTIAVQGWLAVLPP